MSEHKESLPRASWAWQTYRLTASACCVRHDSDETSLQHQLKSDDCWLISPARHSLARRMMMGMSDVQNLIHSNLSCHGNAHGLLDILKWRCLNAYTLTSPKLLTNAACRPLIPHLPFPTPHKAPTCLKQLCLPGRHKIAVLLHKTSAQPS